MIADAKQRFLNAANADGRGGTSSVGVRYWLTYATHVLGISPIMPQDASPAMRRFYEGKLEDMCIWIALFRPGSARGANADTIGKYASQARAWHFRWYGTLGMGSAQSRISDLMRGMARTMDMPPPRVRHGIEPVVLARGLARLDCEPVMWRAALGFGQAVLARACEFALDDSRREQFEASQHITPDDVTFFFDSAGVQHARIRMRKRKDLRVLRGKQALVVLAGGGSHYDPVQWLVCWLRRRAEMGLPSDGPIFCHPSGASITTSEVRAMVREVAALGGHAFPALLGGHSLRIGGATAALAAGVPPQLIRLMGRWCSDVYEVYCRMSQEAAVGVGRAVTSADVTTLEGVGFRHDHLELLPHELQLLHDGAVEDEA